MSIDEKYEGQHEESEYHFSDENEEVNYEVDAEAKPATASGSGEHKESLINRLGGSKRVMISLAVFLVLMFVAYKMVGQSTAPLGDITPASVTTAQSTPMQASQPAPNQPAAVAPAQPAQVAAQTAVPPGPETATQTAAQPAPVASANQIANPAQAAAPGAVVQPTETGMPSALQAVPGAVANSVIQAAQQMTQQPAIQQPQAAQQQAQTPQQPSVAMPGAPNVPVVTALPSVIPAQTAVPSNQPAVAPSVLSSMGAYIDARSAALNAASQKSIEQLQGQVTQQVNDFTTQNKALQDQVQTLNSRVAAMESKLNQLVQVLTRRTEQTGAPAATQQGPGSPPSSMVNPGPAVPVQAAGPDVKIAYNVQAIIPGRAWLKSDNGETLTVTEGDMIRGVGRVSKIDPYDGVVEINTGTRAVSLSYGNGG